MRKSVVVQVYRIFVDSSNHFGNPVGIVIDTSHRLDDRERVRICELTGFSEVVFIEDIPKQTIRIYNPQEEIDFSGHAGIGAARYFFSITGKSVGEFAFRNGRAQYEMLNNIMWISTTIRSLPPWNLRELATVREVEQIDSTINVNKAEHTVFWSWQKDMRTIRARTFAPDWGIPEDEANGSGALLLTLQIKQNLTFLHGKGSVIYTKYSLGDIVSVGGRVNGPEKLYITL